MGLLNPNEWKANWIGFDASRQRDAGGRKPDLALASWIWHAGENATNAAPAATRYFRKEFAVPENRELVSAFCAVSVDNGFTLFVNGQQAGNGNSFKEAFAANLAEHLRKGKNVIAVEARNEGDSANPAGLLAVVTLRFKTGEPITIVSDEQWSSSQSRRGRLDGHELRRRRLAECREARRLRHRALGHDQRRTRRGVPAAGPVPSQGIRRGEACEAGRRLRVRSGQL